MESVASNSTQPSSRQHHRPYRGSWPTQPVTDRIVRALRHHLLLLHRSGSTFFVLGATGNVYSVALTTSPTCTCPDRTTPCKHILFVLIRALCVSVDDVCLRRRTLRPCLLSRLLRTPTSPGSLAGPRLRERFHQLFFQAKNGRCPAQSSSGVVEELEIEEGTVCPVCLEEMNGKGEGETQRAVACGTCRNVIHEECLARWKRSRGRGPPSCVFCRARWRDTRATHNNQQDKYLNLAAFVNQDDALVADNPGSLCAG